MRTTSTGPGGGPVRRGMPDLSTRIQPPPPPSPEHQQSDPDEVVAIRNAGRLICLLSLVIAVLSFIAGMWYAK